MLLFQGCQKKNLDKKNDNARIGGTYKHLN